MRDLDVFVFGTGGAAKGFLWHLNHPQAVVRDKHGEYCRPRVVGFIDDNTEVHGQLIHEVPVVGGVPWLEAHAGEAVFVGLGFPTSRERVVERLRTTDVWFPNFVSPDARIAADLEGREGVFVSSGVVSTFDCHFGDFTLLNINSTFGHDSVIGEFGNLNPGATISGGSLIGRCVDFGANSTLIQGKSVGDYVVVGAGACVVRDVPDHATVVGVPARILRIGEAILH